MDTQRKFEETELTKTVCEALKMAALRMHGFGYSLEDKNRYLELLNLIKKGNMDIRLYSREGV